MDIRIDLPEELDRELDAISAVKDVSKSDLIIEGLRLLLEQRSRRQ